MTERDLLALLGALYEADEAALRGNHRRSRDRLMVAMGMVLAMLDEVRSRT